MELTTEIKLSHNGETWVYDFGKLSVQQIFAAQAWFTFYTDMLSNPPGSAKQLKLTGATDYLREAIALLLLPVEGEKIGQFDPDTTPEKAAKFLSIAPGLFEKVREIQKDFFLQSGTLSPESVAKSKRQIAASGLLLQHLTAKEGKTLQG